MQQTTFLFVQVFRDFKRLATHAIFSLIRFFVNVSGFLAPPPHLLRSQLVTLFGGADKRIVGYIQRRGEFFEFVRVFVYIFFHVTAFFLTRANASACTNSSAKPICGSAFTYGKVVVM